MVGQIEAIRKGLTQVVPQAAFELFTWKEVEKRICGDPEITITALRQNSETILHCCLSQCLVFVSLNPLFQSNSRSSPETLCGLLLCV